MLTHVRFKLLTDAFSMSLETSEVEKLQKELQLLTLENIRRYPEYKSKQDDFYSMWQRFGPDAARTILIPYIWDGRLPRPSEVVN